MELTKNMDKEKFSKWLQIELDRRGWNQADLSRKSGVSTGQIARLMSGERGLGENSVKAIASALRIPTNLVYQAAGFLQPPSGADTWLDEQTHKMSLGIRAEELCNIKIGQVDKRLMRVKVFGKGAKDRYVSFSARAAQSLWRYLSTRPDATDNQYLFAARGSSGQFTRTRLLKMLISIGQRAGAPFFDWIYWTILVIFTSKIL